MTVVTWKSYTVVSGAGLLATWLVSTPAVDPQRPAASPRAAATAVQSSLDIAEQAERLRARARVASPYEEPTRNPFRFASPAAPSGESAPRQPMVAEEPVPVDPGPPPPPPIRLTGIATETVDGSRRRIAILVTGQGVVDVREGDAVGAEYRVARIEDNAIELVAADGTTRRLTLRP